MKWKLELYRSLEGCRLCILQCSYGYCLAWHVVRFHSQVGRHIPLYGVHDRCTDFHKYCPKRPPYFIIHVIRRAKSLSDLRESPVLRGGGGGVRVMLISARGRRVPELSTSKWLSPSPPSAPSRGKSSWDSFRFLQEISGASDQGLGFRVSGLQKVWGASGQELLSCRDHIGVIHGASFAKRTGCCMEVFLRDAYNSYLHHPHVYVYASR